MKTTHNSRKTQRARSKSSGGFTRSALIIALALAFGSGWVYLARAANPANGTLDATVGGKVEWVGTAVGAPAGGPAQDTTCEEGVNCDSFELTLSGNPEDYSGKQLVINISWTSPTNDYDLYIRKDALNGNLVTEGDNGFAGTSDAAAINPATSGTGKYFIRVVYATVAGPTDQYRASAEIAQAPEDAGKFRPATHVSSGITFSKNVTVKAPVSARDGEPSIRTDYKGNSYTGGIRGLPAGVDLWYFDLRPTLSDGTANPTFDPNMRIPIYRGQPDGTTEKTEADVGGDGGGDIDLAVGFPPLLPTEEAPEVPVLAYSSLTLVNISSGKSQDRGETFELNPAGNLTGGPPGDDRQWHEALGANTIYLLYRTIAPTIAQVQRSDDGGFTYSVTASVGTIGQVGCLDVHQATGTVYASGSTGNVAVGTPSIPGAAPLASDYVIRQAATDPRGVAHIFFVTKVADDGTPNGTLYVVYSNQENILLKSSKDKGETWTDPVRVNPPDGPFVTGVNLFPWMETGPTPGSVGIVWYGAKQNENNDNAQWKVYYAQSFNADSAAPTFRVGEVTEPEHFIHGSNISEMGLNPTAGSNRNLIDYFQVSFDPQGAAVVAYTDDHNDFDGNVYVARQITGPGIKGTDLPPVTEGNGLVLPAATASVEELDNFPPQQPGRNGEQVTDFPLDVQSALVTRVRQPDSLDIESVRYDTSGTGDSLAIAATMRVTDLTVVPPGSFWRASFVANAPNSIISADGTYSYGISDDGDQFYVEAQTTDGGQTFVYGTAVRNPDGTITYTEAGEADAGEFNTDTRTINIQVSVAKLNAILSAANRPLIQNGSPIAGLRARAVTAEVVAPPPAGRQGRRDLTRGGTQFTVYDNAFPRPTPAPSASPLPPRAVVGDAVPSPTPPEVGLANIATRVAVRTGENVGIAGFIVRGNAPKRLMVRGIGPSIRSGGEAVAGTLQNPRLEIREGDDVIASNDDWRGTEDESQQAEITASGLAPIDDREAAVIINVSGGDAGATYTAILSGVDDTEGIGLIEVYDIDAQSMADLGNISTRGFVGTGNDVLIGGIIVRDASGKNQSQDILVRGIGPSLGAGGVVNPLQDPQLTLYDVQGNTIAFNDDFATDPQGNIPGSGLPPTNAKESAIRRTLAPSAYTFILNGANGGTGIGLVEAYNLGNQ